MTQFEKLQAILAAVQIDPGNRGLARHSNDNLFNAYPHDFAEACEAIADDPLGNLGILTGFFIPTAVPPALETDGPLGAVFLADAMAKLGIGTVILVDHSRTAIESGLRARDRLRERHFDNPDFALDGTPLTYVNTVPPPKHPWSAFVALDWMGVVSGRGIKHVVSIERVGPSRSDGRCYSMRGKDITEFTSPMHHLVDECHRVNPRIHTIGIGDGGNEIGMGKISWASVAKNIENGDQIACRVPTDHLIVTGVSNWGAYALAAGVYVLRNEKPPAELFDPEIERKILEIMVKAGPLVDGVTGQQTATVDGLTWEEYIQPMIRIREILET